jgi:DNA-binding transcriptional regulator LsrR (DeoR family)
MNLEKANQARDMYFRQRMKQGEIAAILGVRQNTVSRIISGMVWS